MELATAGYGYTHCPTEVLAIRELKERAYDLVVLAQCEQLEEADMVAERFKQAAREGASPSLPYVFALWDGAIGFEKGKDFELKAVDIIFAGFSVRQCEQAYQYIRHNATF